MRTLIAILALAAPGALWAASAAPSAPDADPKEVLAAQGTVSERGNTPPQSHTTDGNVTRGSGERAARKATVESAERVNQDFWVFDADLAIADDFDLDGFFTRVELSFDVDTVFNAADVYAVLYLSLEGGPWTEYGVTDVFTIYGASGGDEYFYDADLVSGFPTGYYDVLIEIYDTFDGRLVADFGPDDTGELFDLPLESISFDGPGEPIVVVSSEGGGSAGWVLLALLGGLAARRQLFRGRN